ncbi:MAG: right-handed parallel beta-helix repeat-containing protein [Verrucomicrobiota bacterium]
MTAFCAQTKAAEFFVAPTGSDGAAGTLAAPFATVQRAQTAAEPGDTVWLRGGTYKMSEAQIARTVRPYACVIYLDKSGTEGKPIRYWAYQEERPVFDLSEVKPAGRRVTAFRVQASWLHLRGLEVVGVQVTITGHTQSICFDNQGSHNVYERLSMHDGMAIGVWIGNGAHNLVLNCDAYRNHDPVSGNKRGGNVDGFGYHGPKGSVGNVFRGCRAWFNSDDGFDFINSAEAATVENCWAFYNGYAPDFASLADGNGFKAGGHAGTPVERLPQPIPRHLVRRSLAVKNKANGFYANHHIGGVDFVHNTALRNRVNFNLLGRADDNKTDVPGYGHRLKNNLGLEGGREVAELNAEKCEVAGNYFDAAGKVGGAARVVTAKDFLSVDEAELVKPRQSNGDLPDVPFLRPAPGSVAIDRGVILDGSGEAPFAGKAPDMGAYEFREEKR